MHKKAILLVVMLVLSFLPLTIGEETFEPFDPTDWLYYDNGISDSGVPISGLTWTTLAIRLTPTELSGYDGYEITTVRFWHNTTAKASHVGDVIIYANGTASTPGSIITSESLSVSGSGWKNVTLSSPVTIDDTEEYWVGVNITDLTGTTDYPRELDTQLAVDGKGDFINMGAGWNELQNFGAPYDHNLFIRAGLEVPTGGITIYRPSADYIDEWLAHTEPNPNWIFVDDVIPDDGGGVCGAVPPDVLDVYNTTKTSGSISGNIENVTIFVRAWDVVGAGVIRVAVYNLSTDEINYSSNINLNNTWWTYQYTWESNPFTASDWTWGELSSDNFGIGINATSGNFIQNTQIYAEVVWTEAPPPINSPPVFSNENPVNGSIDQNLSLEWNITIEDLEGDWFNSTLECSNGNITWYSYNTNGSFNFQPPITGLSLNTTYMVWVNSSDNGSGLWTREWFTFKTKEYHDWDINQDNIINYLDVSSLVSHYGETGDPGWIRDDINDDGIVNYLDVSALVSHYGESY